jgi:2-polyprenyl-6-methoxyphenol hydroxylase-like FAD-dependent oxidoreductase
VNRRLRIAVVGGGIGGLTTAITLGADHEVVVFERESEFEGIGAGLVMAANATAILDVLGVDLRPIGRILTTSEIRRADGTRLQSLDVATPATRLGPMIALSRPALHAALLAATRALGVSTQSSVAVVAVDADSTTLQFGDGNRDSFDLVVGADGIHSSVRTAVVGDVAKRYSGVTCWRGVVPDWGVNAAVEYWGGRTRIGLVPIVEGIYYYLVASATAREPGPTDLADLRAKFSGYSAAATRVFDSIEWPPPYHHDLWELDVPVWGMGNAVLLGDAAHSMTPNLGQGAAMAIEDAIGLALAIRQVGEPEEVLAVYRGLRHERVRSMQMRSRRFGQLAHATGLRRRVRDFALRFAPGEVGTRAHERLVQPGIELARRFGS